VGGLDAITAMANLTPFVLLLAACGSVTSSGNDPDAGSGSSGEPSGDAPDPASGRCDPARPFGAPTVLGQFNTTPGFRSLTLALTADELTAVDSERGELRASRRPDLDSDFSLPGAELFDQVNVGIALESPSITGDGLHLYFSGEEGFLLSAARPDVTSSFGAAQSVIVQGQRLLPSTARIASDGKTLYWMDLNGGKLNAAGAIDSVTFGAAQIASTMDVADPVLAADELRLYYSSGGEILVATRATVQNVFEPGAPLLDVNTSGREAPLFITADDCELYLQNDLAGPAGSGDVLHVRRGR